ncbi:MAG: hypothetical protein NTU53_21370 [Planctomycetota bacterium]|nr:hypothetical protein [Planctomycetota bacterium]
MAARFPGWTGRKALSKKQSRRELARACQMERLEERQLLTLMIDLRMADGSKSIKVTSPNQQIDLEVWATVTGANEDSKDDGLGNVMGSFKSPNVGTGSALVNLIAEPLAPVNSAPATGGTQADLDGDGDLDIGSNTDGSADGFFLARYPPSVKAKYTRTPKRIATLTATVGQLLPGVETDITFVPRQADWPWVEDGNIVYPKSSSIQVSPFKLLRTDAAAPTATLNALAAVVEGGSTYDFSVTYNDDLSVNRSTIGDGDVIVTDPSGQVMIATLVSANQASSASQITATYRINAPGGIWDGTKNGTYTIAMAANQVSDDAGKAVAAGNLGTFAVALVVPEGIPTAALSGTGTAAGGAASVDFAVTYTDDHAVSRATIGDGDVVVTGPDGKALKVVLVSADQAADAATIVATYRASAPGGMWDATRNGTYTVTMGTGQVTDAAGYSVVTANLGTFAVNVGNAVLSTKGILRVIGTNRKDNISLSTKGKKTYVVMNGTKSTFSTTAVKKIQVYAMGGNDLIVVGRGVMGSLLDGGTGKDTITGGDGNDAIYVRDGSVDVINGGKGKNSARVDKGDKVTNVQVFLR